MRIASLLFLAPLLAVAQVPKGTGSVLPFWAKAGAKSDARVLSVRPHELCSGDIAKARVTETPNPKSDPALTPYEAFEITEQGIVLKRWAIPIEYVVVGVRGNSLLLCPSWDTTPNRNVLVVLPDRKFHFEKSRTPTSIGESFVLSKTPQTKFLDGYEAWKLVDLKTGSTRIIAYFMPCS